MASYRYLYSYLLLPPFIKGNVSLVLSSFFLGLFQPSITILDFSTMFNNDSVGAITPKFGPIFANFFHFLDGVLFLGRQTTWTKIALI
ncbi:hypothetical protein GOM46_07900 [Streptococcus infantis]|nr:hypothetical protein GOM46_07900 [Streptococcus infantis]